MNNRAMFQQFNNMQNAGNPAMYRMQLEKKLKDMQSSGVDPDAEIKKGISDGKINQEHVNFAYSLAKNIARNLFGYTGQN